MNRIGPIIFVLCLLSFAPSLALADDVDVSPPGGPAAVDETHPIYSADARWVPSVLTAIAGLFLAATVVGRFVRTEMVDDVYLPQRLLDD